MPARLLAYFAERPARDWMLGNGRRYVLGRDEECDLRLEDDRVSRRHALIEGGDDGWRIRDLGSKNGTAIDGRRLVGESPPQALPAMAWLSFGGLPARFEGLNPHAGDELSRIRRERRASTNGLGARLDPHERAGVLLDRTLDSLVGLVDAERASVLLGDHPARVAAVRAFPPDTGRPATFAGSRGAVERAYATGQPVVAADALADAPLAARGSILAGGIRALVCLPLAGPTGTFGALYADSRKAGVAFTELDLELLEALASHAALALTAARLSGELQQLMAEAEEEKGPARPPGRRAK